MESSNKRGIGCSLNRAIHGQQLSRRREKATGQNYRCPKVTACTGSLGSSYTATITGVFAPPEKSLFHLITPTSWFGLSIDRKAGSWYDSPPQTLLTTPYYKASFQAKSILQDCEVAAIGKMSGCITPTEILPPSLRSRGRYDAA